MQAADHELLRVVVADDHAAMRESLREGSQNAVHQWLLYSAEAYAAGTEASPVVTR